MNETPANRQMDRLLDVPGLSNFRDVGGYRSEDGRSVRWRTIFRSGALAMVGPEGFQHLANYGIATVCDFRSLEERALAPTNWQGQAPRMVASDYPGSIIFERQKHSENESTFAQSSDLYSVFPDLLRPHFKLVFDSLLEGHAPILLHCTAGQDRTGLAIGLVLAALGVPREVILEDYHLSTRHRRTELEIPEQAVRAQEAENLVAAFYMARIRRQGRAALAPQPLFDAGGTANLARGYSAIETRWGSLDAYFEHALDLDGRAISSLRDRYLEP